MIRKLHTCKEQQQRVSGQRWRGDMPWDLVGLDRMVLDRDADGDKSSDKGERDRYDEPDQHNAKVHPNWNGATGA